MNNHEVPDDDPRIDEPTPCPNCAGFGIVGGGSQPEHNCPECYGTGMI